MLINLETKRLTVVIVLSALAIALEPLRVPVFFWPGQYFHFWEIPAIIGFFLYDLKVGFYVGILGSIGYGVIFPSALGFVGPVWRILVLSVMLTGLWLAKKLVNQNAKVIRFSPGRIWNNPLVNFTAVATIIRVAIVPLVDLSMYQFAFPAILGRVYSDVYLIGLVPAIIFFNLLLSMFSFPVAFIVSKRVNAGLKINNEL